MTAAMKKTVTTSSPRGGRGYRLLSGTALLALAAAALWLLRLPAADEKTAAIRGAPSAETASFAPPALRPAATQRPLTPAFRRAYAPFAPAFFFQYATNQMPQEVSGEDDALDARSPEFTGTTPAPKQGRPREPALFAQLRDHRSKPIPKEVRDLAAEVTKDCTNDASRARAIYDWITANIKYDTAEWRNIVSGADSYAHPHDPASVLERGTTVCIGYAWLFDDMCEAAGLESTFLIGDVRGYRGTPDEELVSNVRHAWSAVREDGEWKLLDATWGARQDGEGEADYKARADYYFDTPPGQFVFDHLPEDADWQLLENPVPSETAFSILPNLKPAFFTDGLKLGGEYTSVLGAKAGERHRLVFGKPAGTEVAFTLGPASDGAASKQIRAVRAENGKAVSAIIPPLTSGDHLLRVYSRTGGGPFNCGADFVIHVE